MTTLNGLPAHILLVHAVVVLLPLAALILAASALRPAIARRMAGPNAVLAAVVLGLVPLTTDAGEWLERRVPETTALREHTELGDTALYVAIPVAVLAVIVWWRTRESRRTGAQVAVGPGTATRTPRRTFLAPTSSTIGVVIAVLAVVAAAATLYDVYLIGDSGAQASWLGRFTL